MTFASTLYLYFTNLLVLHLTGTKCLKTLILLCTQARAWRGKGNAEWETVPPLNTGLHSPQPFHPPASRWHLFAGTDSTPIRRQISVSAGNPPDLGNQNAPRFLQALALSLFYLFLNFYFVIKTDLVMVKKIFTLSMCIKTCTLKTFPNSLYTWTFIQTNHLEEESQQNKPLSGTVVPTSLTTRGMWSVSAGN